MKNNTPKKFGLTELFVVLCIIVILAFVAAGYNKAEAATGFKLQGPAVVHEHVTAASVEPDPQSVFMMKTLEGKSYIYSDAGTITIFSPDVEDSKAYIAELCTAFKAKGIALHTVSLSGTPGNDTPVVEARGEQRSLTFIPSGVNGKCPE